MKLVDAVWVSVKSEDGEVTLTDREDPLDIIKLCEALVAIVPDADIKVTLPMLGRVAFLVCHCNFISQSFLMSPSARYSSRSRPEPSSGRRSTSCLPPSAPNMTMTRFAFQGMYPFIASCNISNCTNLRAVAKVLKNDCKCYGSPDLAVFS